MPKRRQPDDAPFMSKPEDIERMEQERSLWLRKPIAAREHVAATIIRRSCDASDPFQAERLRNEIVTGLRVPQDYGMSPEQIEKIVGGVEKKKDAA